MSKKPETAEDVLADLEKKKGTTEDDSKTAYYRKRKAEEFVQGYKLVKQLREADESGEPFTHNRAVDMLIEHWENNADTKDTEEI